MSSSKGGRKVGTKPVIWKSEEIIQFAQTFLKLYPDADTSSNSFKLTKDQFIEVQKVSKIKEDRYRPSHSSVLEKESRRIQPILEALRNNVPLDQVIRKQVQWTDAEYETIANILHYRLPTLNLMFSERPIGFSVADLEDAQKALPLDRRRFIADTFSYIPKLKAAYDRMRDAPSTPSVTKIDISVKQSGPIVTPTVIEQKTQRTSKWSEEEWLNLAKEIIKQNPHGNHLHSVGLPGLRPIEIIAAQRVALTSDRRRTAQSIAQAMQNSREHLLKAFATLRTQIEEQSKPTTLAVAPDALAIKSDILASPIVEPNAADKPSDITVPLDPETSSHSENRIEESNPSPMVAAIETQSLAAPQPTAVHAAPQITTPLASAQHALTAGVTPAAVHPPPPHAAAPSPQPAPNVVAAPPQTPMPASTAAAENARPMVAMVAQEVLRAIKESFGTDAAEVMVQNILRNTLTGLMGLSGQSVAPSFVVQQAVSQPPAPQTSVADFSRDGEPSVPTPDEATSPNPSPASFNLRDDHEDMEDSDPPQPPFDPRLPPKGYLDGDYSDYPEDDQRKYFNPIIPPPGVADISKPRIGLVGVNYRDVETLRGLYPELDITSVNKNTRQMLSELQQCHRVIGIPTQIQDGLLTKKLAGRYKKISGGVPKIREQLDAWIKLGTIRDVVSL